MTKPSLNGLLNSILALMLIAIMFLPIVSAQSSIVQTENMITDDNDRTDFVNNLKEKGYSDKQIAQEIFNYIKEKDPNVLNSTIKRNSSNNHMKSNPKPISESSTIWIDPRIENSTANWEYLVATPQEKQNLLDSLEQTKLTIDDKKNTKEELKEIWKKYPVKFVKDGNTTRIVFDLPDKNINLKANETLILLKTEQAITEPIIENMVSSKISSDQSDLITPKWAGPEHNNFIYYSLQYWGPSEEMNQLARSAASVPDSWSFIPDWMPSDYLPYFRDIVFSYNMYYNRVSPLRFKGGAPDETQYWINQAKNDLNNGQINNAYTHLGYASHFLTDVGNPLHTGRELDQAKQGDLVYMNGIWVWVPHVHRWIHDDYEVYVNNYWNDYFFASAHSQDFYTKSYLATNDASDEAILVSNQAHNDVDELYLLIHNNPVTWRSESTRSINGRTAREITSSNVFKTATGANTLVLLDFLLKPLPNYSNLPNDPDVDHLFEDVNGDQVFDFRDVVDLFQNMEWMQLNEPHNLFNFDNDNQITYGDVVVLFQQVP
jgi:hypothetical protein